MRRVLVVHPGWFLGALLCRRLAADAEYVVAVDSELPDADLGNVDFVRADVRRPVLLRLIEAANIDTVVHLGIYTSPGEAGGRTAMHDLNVVGSMQLFAACQRAACVQRVIVRSSTAVYGVDPKDPALLTEDMERSQPRDPLGRDAYEMEDQIVALRRTRPDITLSIFRFTNILGPGADSPLAAYLARRVIPTRLGFDPRIQFLHSSDALEILAQAVERPVSGLFNAATDDLLYLSQAIRIGGRVPFPMPARAMRALRPVARFVDRGLEIPQHVQDQLSWGRVADNHRLRTQFGYSPAFTSRATLEDFYAGLKVAPVHAHGDVRDRDVEEFVTRMQQ